jgi:Brp/Blh family beta-carotene 15,15'-monooxygenase
MALALVALALRAPLSEAPTLAVAVLLGGVVVLGLPHGAADPWVAASAVHSTGHGGRRIAFLLAYAACALGVVLAWSAWPAASLALFLGVSVLHFGLADTRGLGLSPVDRTLTGLQRGLLPIALPFWGHGEEVAAVLEVLIGAESGALEALTLATGVQLFAIWIALALAACLARLRESGARASSNEALTTAALFSIFALLPPLPAFALYFGAWHSLRHLRLISGLLSGDRVPRAGVAVGGFALWAASAGLLMATPELLPLSATGPAGRTDAAGFDPRLLQSVFIGLAALTLPHVLLTDGLAQLRGTWSRAMGARGRPEVART